MGNIVSFPGRKPPDEEREAIDAEAFEAEDFDAVKPRRKSVRVLLFALNIFRYPLFIFFHWFRIPITIVCRLVSLPLFILAVAAWYMGLPDRMIYGFAAISFLAFFFLFAYDALLWGLAPNPQMLQMG